METGNTKVEEIPPEALPPRLLALTRTDELRMRQWRTAERKENENVRLHLGILNVGGDRKRGQVDGQLTRSRPFLEKAVPLADVICGQEFDVGTTEQLQQAGHRVLVHTSTSEVDPLGPPTYISWNPKLAGVDMIWQGGAKDWLNGVPTWAYKAQIVKVTFLDHDGSELDSIVVCNLHFNNALPTSSREATLAHLKDLFRTCKQHDVELAVGDWNQAVSKRASKRGGMLYDEQALEAAREVYQSEVTLKSVGPEGNPVDCLAAVLTPIGLTKQLELSSLRRWHVKDWFTAGLSLGDQGMHLAVTMALISPYQHQTTFSAPSTTVIAAATPPSKASAAKADKFLLIPKTPTKRHTATKAPTAKKSTTEPPWKVRLDRLRQRVEQGYASRYDRRGFVSGYDRPSGAGVLPFRHQPTSLELSVIPQERPPLPPPATSASSSANQIRPLHVPRPIPPPTVPPRFNKRQRLEKEQLDRDERIRMQCDESRQGFLMCCFERVWRRYPAFR